MLDLIAQNISKSYGKKTAVQDVSIRVSTGEVVGLLGPNGAGKTTSFYCIVGLVRMDSGTISIGGTDVSNAPMHVRARKGLSYLPQESSVFRQLSVKANVQAIAEFRTDLARKNRAELVAYLLEEFRLDPYCKSIGCSIIGGRA